MSRQYLCDIEHDRRAVSAKVAASIATHLVGYSPKQFIRLALQDELIRQGFNYEVDLHEGKDAA